VLVNSQVFGCIGIALIYDACCAPVNRLRERVFSWRHIAVRQDERYGTRERQQQAGLTFGRIVNMDEVEMRHQTVSHDGRPDGRPDSHIIEQIQPLCESHVSDQYVLLYVPRLQGLHQADEMFTRAVEGLRQIDVTDMHVQAGRGIFCAAADSSSLP